MKTEATGIFCANSWRKRGIFPQCMAAWCQECYRQYPNDPFPVQESLNEEDEEEDLEETGEFLDSRFKHARNGDHLMGMPFYCDFCHFINLAKRAPNPRKESDVTTLMYIRRATLDAFWSRTPGTVTSNLSRLRVDYKKGMEVLSIDCPLPVLGTDSLDDEVGMGPMLLMLHATLRSGRYASTLQFDTARRTLTWVNNAYEAGEGSTNIGVLSNFEKSLHLVVSPVHSRWRERMLLEG